VRRRPRRHITGPELPEVHPAVLEGEDAAPRGGGGPRGLPGPAAPRAPGPSTCRRLPLAPTPPPPPPLPNTTTQPVLFDLFSRVGDAISNDTLDQEISPLFHADKIRAPLLIAQGGNDPRVPKAEADQIFKALKGRGLDVSYILYPDEGHGLVRPANRLDFYSRADQFLAKYLGGRAEPLLSPNGTSAVLVA
jgi:acetyl esterase/lipase